MNNSDPFGLKVCFTGSDKSIERQKQVAERATGTTIKLDPDERGCVKEAVATGPSTATQAAFINLVNDPSSTLYVKFAFLMDTKVRFHMDGDMTMWLRRSDPSKRYHSRDSAGNCRQTANSHYSFESAFAHELGHISTSAYGVLPSQFSILENEVLAAQGRDVRNCYHIDHVDR